HGARNMLAGAGLAEEGVERVVTRADSLVRRHLPVGLDSVLQAVQLPAGVSHLDASLAEVNRETFALVRRKKERERRSATQHRIDQVITTAGIVVRRLEVDPRH